MYYWFRVKNIDIKKLWLLHFFSTKVSCDVDPGAVWSLCVERFPMSTIRHLLTNATSHWFKILNKALSICWKIHSKAKRQNYECNSIYLCFGFCNCLCEWLLFFWIKVFMRHEMPDTLGTILIPRFIVSISLFLFLTFFLSFSYSLLKGQFREKYLKSTGMKW